MIGTCTECGQEQVRLQEVAAFPFEPEWLCDECYEGEPSDELEDLFDDADDFLDDVDESFD